MNFSHQRSSKVSQKPKKDTFQHFVADSFKKKTSGVYPNGRKSINCQKSSIEPTKGSLASFFGSKIFSTFDPTRTADLALKIADAKQLLEKIQKRGKKRRKKSNFVKTSNSGFRTTKTSNASRFIDPKIFDLLKAANRRSKRTASSKSRDKKGPKN